jgi:hypothetical protein
VRGIICVRFRSRVGRWGVMDWMIDWIRGAGGAGACGFLRWPGLPGVADLGLEERVRRAR